MAFTTAIFLILLVVCIMGLLAHIADSKQDSNQTEAQQDNQSLNWSDPDQ